MRKTSMSKLLNRSPTCEILLKCGLRHEDSLSYFLLLLDMEMLNALLCASEWADCAI